MAGGTMPSGPIFPVRSVLIGTFVPTVLFEMGVGAVMPIIPATATSLGASLQFAGFVLALIPVGQILADLPAGALAARIGDRSAMMLAGLFGAMALAAAAFAPSLAILAVAMLALGAATAVFFLARQSYLTGVTEPLRRARVLSTLGGVHRIGVFLGPFVGAAIISISSMQYVYIAAMVFALASVVVAGIAEPARAHRRILADDAPKPVRLGTVARQHTHVLATLGLVALLIGAVRSARTTVLPLWGEYLGLDPAATSVVFGISALFDALLFYPAGWTMDKFGRLAIGVPAMLAMGVALAVLPFTATVAGLSWVAVLLGLGNGLSSGILMTLGADVAPEGARSQFLAIWRVFTDFGAMLGPLVLAGAAALGSLAAGVWAMAGSSLFSAYSQLRWVPMHTPHASNRTRRAAGLID